jgi:hypothetical protein
VEMLPLALFCVAAMPGLLLVQTEVTASSKVSHILSLYFI